MQRITFSLGLILVFGLLSCTASAQSGNSQAGSNSKSAAFKKISFESSDGVAITADLYKPHQDAKTPFIVLCHQAGWSRGEYREIAPKLNAMGFNCLAIDQRSGGKVNGVNNETMRQAKAWGSSYSSALAIRIAGEHPDKIDGALAFAPGEYFKSQGKSGSWIQQSAKKIKDPVFITSAKNEFQKWRSIAEAIPSELIHTFLPKTNGNHGSRALWKQFDDNESYWTAVKAFLEQVK